MYIYTHTHTHTGQDSSRNAIIIVRNMADARQKSQINRASTDAALRWRNGHFVFGCRLWWRRCVGTGVWVRERERESVCVCVCVCAKE